MLKAISLQNFRSYSKIDFSFENTTLVVGPNTSGKTNLIEAIYLLSTGKGFRSDKDLQMIKFGENFARVKAKSDDITLEVVLNATNNGGKSQYKKLLVNGIARRRVDFASHMPSVLFSPQDLDIIIDSPSLRRDFLDDCLESVDREYRIALVSFIKAIRQRNALLENVRESGIRNQKTFEYWDKLVIVNGQLLTKKRQEFIDFFNSLVKDIFDCQILYDKSEISEERLVQYRKEEVASGVTLVGPHRDDFSVLMSNSSKKTMHDVKFFGSRGQQRLVILQLKIAQISFIEKRLGTRPIFILDDIFSELDEGHINLIFDQIGKQQVVLTTTHKEFIPKRMLKQMKIIDFN